MNYLTAIKAIKDRDGDEGQQIRMVIPKHFNEKIENFRDAWVLVNTGRKPNKDKCVWYLMTCGIEAMEKETEELLHRAEILQQIN